MRLIFCWAVPFWILIELMPTKLPHYGLPVFPAICLMMGTAVLAMNGMVGFNKTRLFSGLIFILTSIAIMAVLVFVQSHYGDMEKAVGTYVICGISGIIAITAGIALWGNKIRLSLGAALASALICSAGAYIYILPSLTDFKTSQRLRAELDRFAPDAKSSDIHSPHYREPSLVYHIGGGIDLNDRKIDLSDGSLVILNARRKNAAKQSLRLSNKAKRRKRCLESSNPVNGINYSNGTPLSLVILREGPC